MITAPDNSRFDAFLRDALKNMDDKFQPFDWSEVEVMLKPQQSSIPAVSINKKNMLTAAAVAGGLLILFGIFKLTQYYSSLPPEAGTPVDSTQSMLPVLDTASVAIVDTSVLTTDSVKIDSTAIIAAQKRKADSLAALVTVDTVAKIKPEVVPVVKAKDKKKKPDTTQKVTAPDTAAPPRIVVDTARSTAPKELIIATPIAPDTAKKSTPDNSGAKKKKAKAKKATPPPTEQKPDIIPTPPDSLK